MAHKLYLLGSPVLETPSGTVKPDRRMAGLLAYLALEGPTHKYKLAGFLWPDAEENTARNNMRQLLRRVRVNGGDVVVGEDLIEIRPDVEVDVKQLSYLETPSLEILKQEVELLAGLEYDDTYEFAEWLTGAREELKDLRSRSARSEAERLERMGNHKQALEYAHVWTRIEPLSEEAHRLVIRLHYLLGDRGAAMAQFERCKQILQQELGTQPLAETLSLLRLIEQGAELQGVKPKAKEATLPTAILRPPVLAGREREWALMEEAWARKQIIYLVGEPGVGKTRLALDFAASKGRFFQFNARPGDASVPLSTLARAMRDTLEALPQLVDQLPAWARRELSRLLPELLDGDTLPPLATEADKLRFFEAMGQVVAARGTAISVVDDIQFVDSATAEATFFLMARFASNPDPAGPRLMGMYRRGELRPEIEERINELVEANLAARIEVEPLSTQAVSTLLQALSEEGLGEMAEALKRFTGGNPLFILETLKDLIESGTLQQGLSTRFTPPGKVLSLITRRLQRLSSLATNLARCAAVARTQFTLELASAVLERPAFELAEAHAELETAQVLRGNAFTHDLVFEALLSGIPKAVAQVLHARTAEFLQTRKASPALIAGHWLEGGDPSKALPWLMEAARQLYSGKEAASFYAQAAQILEQQGQTERAFEAWVAHTRALRDSSMAQEMEAAIERLFASARTPGQRAQAWLARVDRFGLLGDYQHAAELLQQTLSEAQAARDLGLEAEVEVRLSTYHFSQGQVAQAFALLEEAQAKAQAAARPEARLMVGRSQFVMKQMTGDWAGAQPHYQATLELAQALQDYNTQALLHTRAALHYLNLGDAESALRMAQQAWGVLESHHGSIEFRHLSAIVLWATHQMLGNPYQGVRILEQLQQEYAGHNYGMVGVVHAGLALGYLYLGQPQKAIKHYEPASDWPNYPPTALHLVQLVEAMLVEQGLRPFPQSIEPYGGLTPVEMGIVLNMWAKLLPPEQALPLIERASTLGNNANVPTGIIATQTRRAQKLLEAGRAGEALEAIETAVEKVQTHRIIIIDLAEVHFTHYRVLKSLGKTEAGEALAKAKDWIAQVIEKLPEEYRGSFLKGNLVNRAVLEV